MRRWCSAFAALSTAFTAKFYGDAAHESLSQQVHIVDVESTERNVLAYVVKHPANVDTMRFVNNNVRPTLESSYKMQTAVA